MESMEGMFGGNISGTDARRNQNPLKGDGKEADAEDVRVFSIDKVIVDKIFLESSNGSLLTKNETLRGESLSSEPRVAEETRDKEQNLKSSGKSGVSLPRDAFASKSRDTDLEEGRVKLAESSSVAIGDSNSASVIAEGHREEPLRLPGESASAREGDSSLAAAPFSSAKVRSSEDPSSDRQRIIDEAIASEREVGEESAESAEATGREGDDRASCVGKHQEACEVAKLSRKIEKRGFSDGGETVKVRGERASDDREAQDRLERSQAAIEDLQRNLNTGIQASTARSYKEKLRANYTAKPPRSSRGERLSSGFDKEFLERHNLDKRLKIEEKRLLETDLDYASDNGGISETEDHPRSEIKRKYSEKVSEVEKRWSGEFLDNRLQRNSSESSRSSYIEEFGSVSSRESIIEDCDSRLLFDRKRPLKFAERQTSLDESKRRASEEILENSTVSTVDSDSCLEDRIKAVDEDIAERNGIQTDDNDEFDEAYDREENQESHARWDEKTETVDTIPATRLAVREKQHRSLKESVADVDDHHCASNSSELRVQEDIDVAKSEKRVSGSIRLDPSDDKKRDTLAGSLAAIRSKDPTKETDHYVIENYQQRDGYASFIKDFIMEAGSSRTRKEEKQKKKLGFRRLLPAIFSPKDSRKDYKKKEQKERKKYDERYFARYQQNGNYTRSPDTMNLNEDIKRNVKLDNSLNGSIIEERLEEIKRELFPQQGPITSTPDHFLQTDDARLLRDRSRGQRSYTTDSSLSSIAPDERWMERGGHLGISPDIRKYEQRQRREEHDGSRRYGQLERKHSLQEPAHGGRTYLFQRNHGASGRISAPPAERYLMRPRIVHPIDRPLPEIPQSRVELCNYENYEDGMDQPRDDFDYRNNAYADNADYQNQSAFYQGDGNDLDVDPMPQSVPAQVKITRQPIVNQTQKAPLMGKTSKYPSSGSSQKSCDYADSSCTPNSSQKSEFSPSSSKSGEYYLHSPRSSARTSPAERSAFEDTCERIYENGARPAKSPSSNGYIDEHVYDETPSTPCAEEDFVNANASDRTMEKKNHPLYEQKCSPNQQSCEANEQTESKREIDSCEDCSKNHEDTDANSRNESLASSQGERTSVRNVSPSKVGATVATSPSAIPRARRSQPNDQILIASPKREVVCQSRVSRPSNETRLCDANSPIPIADSRDGIPGIVPIEARHQYSSRDSPASTVGRQRTASSSGLPRGISRPEPIYRHHTRQASPARSSAASPEMKPGKRESGQLASYSPLESCRDVDDRVRVQGRSLTPQTFKPRQASDEPGRGTARSPIREDQPGVTQGICQQRRRDIVQQHRATPTSASMLEARRPSPTIVQDKMYTSTNSLQREPIYEQRRAYRPQSRQEPVYVQRVGEPTCPQQGHPLCGPLSPSKRETRQHLEAFYWQQKALEAQRKLGTPNAANYAPRPIAPKVDLPEMREAVYWQQLKRLDEEQQRRIYEQNSMGHGVYEVYYKARAAIPNANQEFAAPGVVHGDATYWSNAQQACPKTSPSKLPLMQTLKGQNQPVLIVRPQQALQDRQEATMNPARDPSRSLDAPRSKSASPHFHRNEMERASFNAQTCRKPVADRGTSCVTSTRKPEVGGTHVEEDDGDGRTRPHPIFKRGSLIGGESVEYGSTGPKRVSFSNQANAGLDLSAGSWPTKRGTAPEPPTRRHKSEDGTSDTDSIFLYQDRADANLDLSCAAGVRAIASKYRTDGACSEQEYDADKPLPPPPMMTRRGNDVRNYVCNDVRWNSEEQRICRRKQGEFPSYFRQGYLDRLTFPPIARLLRRNRAVRCVAKISS